MKKCQGTLLSRLWREEKNKFKKIDFMWDTIKQILKKNRGTCIIVEDGKPLYVVTQFADYEKLFLNETTENEQVEKEISSPTPVKKIIEEKEVEIAEKINQEIIDWKAKQTENSPEIGLADIVENDELRIENLPFV